MATLASLDARVTALDGRVTECETMTESLTLKLNANTELCAWLVRNLSQFMIDNGSEPRPLTDEEIDEIHGA